MKTIFIAGHKGMVGSHIHALLKKTKNKLITADKKKLNLLDQSKVFKFLKKQKPDQIYICAAKVGGIHANNIYSAKFLYENLIIASNLIHGAMINNIKKILYLGSSCIYPKKSKTPIKEEALLSGYLENTNEGYAIAKICGIALCKHYNKQYKNKKVDYRAVMPCNLYGEGDNFDPNLGHVIPSIIYKLHKAKIQKKNKVYLWGDGKPKREFLHVEDLAKACVHLMNIKKSEFYKKKSYEHYNIGSGKEITIKNLSNIIAKVIDYKGKILFDKKKLNGTMRKVMDISKIKSTGWNSMISLNEGIQRTYSYFLIHHEKKLYKS